MVMLGRKERIGVRARVGMDVGGYGHVALSVKFEFLGDVLLQRHGSERMDIYRRLMRLLT